MQITPLAIPVIDWKSFVVNTTASLGRSPTRSLDGAGIAPGDFPTFLQALGELQKEKTNPVSYFKSEASRSALEHLSFSFLFDLDAPGPLHILMYGKIHVLMASDNSRVFIGTGNLKVWRDLILLGSSLTEVKETRAAMNELLKLFVSFGLGDVFRGYEHVKLRDGTFALK